MQDESILDSIQKDSTIRKTLYGQGMVIKRYAPSADDLKMTLESYLEAGRPLHTDKGLLYGKDALDYIRGNGSQSE